MMLERRIVGMAPAVRLGIIRALVVLAALIYACMENFSSFAEVSTVWFWPKGLMKLVPPGLLEAILTSSFNLVLLKAALISFLLLAGLGIFTRLTLFISTALFFVAGGILYAYGTFFFHGIIVLYLLFFLSLLPSGESFSIDEKVRRGKGKSLGDIRPEESMAWSVFLLRAVVAFSYFQAGFMKLKSMGLLWLQPWNLKKYLIQDSLGMMHFNRHFLEQAMHYPDIFWLAGAALMLGLQLFFPVVLISWEIRRFYPLLAAFFSAFSYMLCPVSIPDTLALLVLLLIFYDWDRVFLRGLLPAQDRRR